MSPQQLRRNPLQEEQRLRTRRAICDAALRVFAELGYNGCTIEQILVAAGVSRAAFYSHFDGKLALVCAIAEDFEPAWRPIFDWLAHLEHPTLATLTDWAAMHLEFHRANLSTCTLLTQVAAIEERMYWVISQQRDALIHMLGEHHAAFAATRDHEAALLEARILLWQVDQTCFQVVRQQLSDPQNVSTRIIARQVLQFLERPQASNMSGEA